MLTLDHVHVTRGGRRLLDDVSTTLGPGVHAITGPNGSGKTTLMRLAAGLVRPDHGEVRVLDRDVARTPPRDLARVVGYLPQRAHDAFLATTLREELHRTHGAAADDVLRAFGLTHLAHRHPLTLSGGERRRAALALALGHDPDLLLLDEPTIGLDGAATDALLDRLHRHRHRCVLVATHDHVLVETADTVLHLSGGHLRRALAAEVG